MSGGQQSLGGAIADAVTNMASLAAALAGLILAFIAYHVTSTQTVPLWALLYSLIGSALMIWALLSALKTALRAGPALPRVLAVIPDPADAEHPVLLLDPSVLFGNATLASVYHRDSKNAYEVLLAHGTVLTVQSDQKIQVKVDTWAAGNDEIVKSVINQSEGSLDRLVVRAGAVRDQAPMDRNFLEAVGRFVIERQVSFHQSSPENDHVGA